jgi:uncharacterized protein (DUF433 family)
MHIDRITIKPDVCGGEPTIRGMRITVSHVLEMLAGGMTPEQVLQDFPYLEKADIDALTATDTQIWDRGRLESLVIFSKDTDFYDRALLYGAPPQVVHVAVGNCSNARLFSVLASEWDEIEQALVSGCRLISITLEKMEVFA